MRTILILLFIASMNATAEPEHLPGDHGPATDAFLNFPESVAVDGDGNIYVTERGGNRVRRIDARSRIITTIASDLHQPTGLAIDRSGNVIVGDTSSSRIIRIDARTGSITVIAGTGEFGFDGDGGPATKARITTPFGLAFDADENLYFTDTEVNRIRRIDRRTGVITTVAGNGVWAYGGDGGPAVAASLARPHRILFDRRGDLIIGDSFNQRIRRVDVHTGIIETIAGAGLRGSSGDGGPARAATFCYFGDLLLDRGGDLLVSGICDKRIRRIDMRSGVVTPYAGDGGTEYGGDGKPFLRASFAMPAGMAPAPDGVYLVDMRSHRICLLNEKTGLVSTIAGGTPPRNPEITWRFLYRKEDFVRERNVPIGYTTPNMDAVDIHEDLPYGSGGLMRFDLYRSAVAGKLPLVVLVSGSNDTEVVPDTWGVFESRARALAASGFAVVMFNHRLGLNGTIDQGAEDLRLLLDALRTRAEELGIDPSRLAIVTYSMGSTALSDLLRSDQRGLKAIVTFYPYADLRELQDWQVPGKTGANAKRYSLIGVPLPPTLVIRAGRDAPLVLKGVDEWVAERLSANAPIEIMNNPEGEAEFDRGDSDPRTPDIMQRVIDFLRHRLHQLPDPQPE